MSAPKLRNATAVVVVAAAIFFGLSLSSSQVLLAQQEETKKPSEPPPQPLRSEPSAALRDALQRQFAAIEREVARLRVAVAVERQHGVEHVLGLGVLGHDAVERLGQVLGR
jgi:hypothetical protein